VYFGITIAPEARPFAKHTAGIQSSRYDSPAGENTMSINDGLGGLNTKQSLFTRVAQGTARWTGKPATFFLAVAIIAAWALSGPFFGFNDTWQLVINTSTTIVTFLMVFIIQNSQNRDTAAMQIKLDELIVRLEGAREELLDLEQLDEDKLEKIRKQFEERAATARDGRDPGPPPNVEGR
jgi:low affinity Fe/Cu permease